VKQATTCTLRLACHSIISPLGLVAQSIGAFMTLALSLCHLLSVSLVWLAQLTSSTNKFYSFLQRYIYVQLHVLRHLTAEELNVLFTTQFVGIDEKK
jgi:hypothetical protein